MAMTERQLLVALGDAPDSDEMRSALIEYFRSNGMKAAAAILQRCWPEYDYDDEDCGYS